MRYPYNNGTDGRKLNSQSHINPQQIGLSRLGKLMDGAQSGLAPSNFVNSSGHDPLPREGILKLNQRRVTRKWQLCARYVIMCMSRAPWVGSFPVRLGRREYHAINLANDEHLAM